MTKFYMDQLTHTMVSAFCLWHCGSTLCQSVWKKATL